MSWIPEGEVSVDTVGSIHDGPRGDIDCDHDYRIDLVQRYLVPDRDQVQEWVLICRICASRWQAPCTWQFRTKHVSIEVR